LNEGVDGARALEYAATTKASRAYPISISTGLRSSALSRLARSAKPFSRLSVSSRRVPRPELIQRRSATMMTVNDTNRRRALIIGGSLGGLFAGSLLRRIGWDVDIFERSPHDLDSRGGGIVLQPEVVEVFRRVDVDLRKVDLGVRSAYRTVFQADGSIQSKHFAPQTQTSWSLIYTTLRTAFGDQNYHQGKTLVRIDQDRSAGKVIAHFDDGAGETGDLLIGADGGNPVGGQRFRPSYRRARINRSRARPTSPRPPRTRRRQQRDSR
jgi:hypothetical protein